MNVGLPVPLDSSSPLPLGLSDLLMAKPSSLFLAGRSPLPNSGLEGEVFSKLPLLNSFESRFLPVASASISDAEAPPF